MMPTLLEQYQADLAYLNAKKDSLVEARGSKLAERAGHAADAAAILEQFVTSNDTAGQQNLVGQDAIAFVNEKIRLTNSRINDIPEAQQRKAFQLSAQEVCLNKILVALPADAALPIDFTRLSVELDHHIDMESLFKILDIQGTPKQYIDQYKPTALRQELISICKKKIAKIHNDITAIYQEANPLNASLIQQSAQRRELLSIQARQVQIGTELEAIESERTELDKLIASYEAIITAEPLRIVAIEEAAASALDARRELIDPLVDCLERYQLQRNAQYQLKDKLTANDKEIRDGFIQDLVVRLDAYQQSGLDDDKLNVLTLIDTNMDNFPGIKLSALLNKIKFELLSFGLPVTVIPVDYIGVNSIPAHYNEPLKSAIVKLYQQLNSMFIYGNTSRDEKVILLERDLKNDLDRFVIENTAVTPTAEIFDAFKARFTARLHSHDDVLSQRHDGQWKPIVANILIALATVGLALVIKAAHSKLTTGRMTSFFSETERQRQADAIKKSVNDIPAPAAMAAA